MKGLQLVEAVCKGREQEVATLVDSGVDVESTSGPDGNNDHIVEEVHSWSMFLS